MDSPVIGRQGQVSPAARAKGPNRDALSATGCGGAALVVLSLGSAPVGQDGAQGVQDRGVLDGGSRTRDLGYPGRGAKALLALAVRAPMLRS